MPGLPRCVAAAFTVLALMIVVVGRADSSPSSLLQRAQAPGPDEAHEPARPPSDGDKPDDAAPAEAESPGTRSLDLTPSQCEAVALGKPIKDLPLETRVEAVTFTEPPPVTLQLPAQSREVRTECSLRASGLTARIDKSRNVITLLPTGARSPEFPNPTIKVTLKLNEEAAKPESP
jgi:hypothetical protein